MKPLVFRNPHLYIPAIGCLFLIGLEFPWWFALLNFGFLFWRFLGEQNQFILPPRWLTNTLGGFVFILVYMYYGTLFDKTAAPLFLSCLCSLKILEYRSQRDHLFIILILMMLLGMKFLFSIDFWLGPIVLWLVCTLFFSLFPDSPKQFRFYFLKTIFIALPLTVFLYFLFPRISPYMMRSGAGIGMTGVGNEIRPGSISQLVQTTELAFRVEFNGGLHLDNRDLYWRGMVLRQNNGFFWSQGPIAQDRYQNESTNIIHYKMTVEGSRQRWTFPLDSPINLSGGSFSVIRKREGTFLTVLPIEDRTILRGESSLLAKAYPLDEKPYLKIETTPEVRTLAKKIKGKLKSRREIVEKIMEHFRDGGFTYTLTPGTISDGSVNEFFFKVKSGFCEHYASAFAILARSAGVPARVIVGYQGGEYNSLGDFYTITSQDAHAWNEFVNDKGEWERVDVVNVVAPLRTQLGAAAFMQIPESLRSFNLREKISESFLSQVVDFTTLYFSSLNFYWTQWLLDFNLDKQIEIFKFLPFPFIVLLFLFTALTFFAFLLYRLWLFWTDQQNLVRVIYSGLLKWAAKNGLPKDPAEGPNSYLVRLKSIWPEDQENFDYIITSYVDFTYANAPFTFDQIYEMAVKLQQIERRWDSKLP